MEKPMIAIDHAILHFINGFALKSWSVDMLMTLLERNRLLKGVVIVAVYWALWFARTEGVDLVERRKTILASIFGTMAAVLTTVFLTMVLPFRGRPLWNPDLNLIVLPGMPEFLSGWSSFPSDTSTLTGGLIMGIFLISRQVGMIVMLYALILVLIPRVYLGLHYPTDIVAGLLIGAFFVFLANRRFVKDRVTNPFMEWSENYPGMYYGIFFFFTFEVGNLFHDMREIGSTSRRILEAIASRFL